MAELTPIIQDSFLGYAGAVLQSRALVDSRDCIKPSARQIFYCLYTDKFVHSKPFQKTLKAIGSAFRMYIHGDSSAEGIIMRAGQPFAYRYPLIEVEGSYGTLIASGSWAAPRYTSSRLSPLAEYLFTGIKKDTIKEWRDNYDDTEQYPMVLPSKGFYNLVNGTYGIGVGASSSIPQYNLKELNDALIKLLWNPDISFDEIYVAPDFATGAIILNGEEVKESHRNGNGRACKIRSVIEYDAAERCMIVKELPYMTYTETICRQLEEIVNGDDNPGIDRFNDLTGVKPLIKIYLSKKANPARVLKYLYKHTSLQTHYGINFTMLENGRFPKVFTWKELLQSHIDHEIEVYTREFQYDLKKIEERLHIIEGLLKAIDAIDEVIKLIKESNSTADASKALQDFLKIDGLQAKAILDIKLSRLAHLEVNKLVNEKESLEADASKIRAILDDENLLKKEIEKGLREVATKFGDNRRTVILNVEGDEDETVEEKAIQISLTNKNNLLVSEVSSLYTQRRGGVGSKIKLAKDEYIVSTASGRNTDILMLFSEKGSVFNVTMTRLPLDEKVPIETLVKEEGRFSAIATTSKHNTNKYVVFLTKKGILKKSKLEDCSTNRAAGLKVISLDADDEIRSILVMNNEKIGIMSKMGNIIIVETKNITPIGRIAKGRKGMNLAAGDEVVCARVIDDSTTSLVSISSKGFMKRTQISEFTVTGLNTKGNKIQKFKEANDTMVDFAPVHDEKKLIVVASKTQIKLDIEEVAVSSRATIGTKSMKIKDSDKIIGFSLN